MQRIGINGYINLPTAPERTRDTRTNGRGGAPTQCETSSTGRPAGKPTAKKMRALLEWQDCRCALTRRELTPENCTADHIIAVSAGGSDAMENMQLVTAEANRAKGTLGQDEFIALCRDVCRAWSPDGQ